MIFNSEESLAEFKRNQPACTAAHFQQHHLQLACRRCSRCRKPLGACVQRS